MSYKHLGNLIRELVMLGFDMHMLCGLGLEQDCHRIKFPNGKALE